MLCKESMRKEGYELLLWKITEVLQEEVKKVSFTLYTLALKYTESLWSSPVSGTWNIYNISDHVSNRPFYKWHI